MITAFRYKPGERLQPFIKTMMIIESEEGMENKLLPDTSIVLAFRLKGKISSITPGERLQLPSSVITGLRKSSRIVNYEKNSSVLLVTFREAALPAFFKIPAHELFGQSISLNQLLSETEVVTLESRLSETQTNEESFRVVEKFLLKLLSEFTPDHLILNAVQQIKLSKGIISIKDLSSTLHISQDAFEKRFRKANGTGPKHFSSIVRFRNLISNYSSSVNFTEMAYDSGYFDQAHFIKNFKSFTGQTPHTFFQSGRYW